MALTALAFLAAYGACCFLAFARHPIFGLYAYLLAFYGSPPDRWWGSVLPDLRWSLTAAAVTLLALLAKREVRNPNPWYASGIAKLFLLYVIYMWIQIPFAASSETHMAGVILFTKYLLMFYFLHHLISDQQSFRRFCMAHVLGCAYFGWLAFNAGGGGRLEGVGGPGVNDSNTLGMHLSTGVIFASMLLLAGTVKEKAASFLSAPWILNGIILTQSRGAFLGLVSAGVVLMRLKPEIYTKRFYQYAFLGVFCFLLLAHDFFYERVIGSIKKVAAGESEELDKSALSRMAIIRAQFHMFADYPLGAGHEGTAVLSRQYIDARWMSKQGGRASHNTFMTLLVNQGILGVFFVVAFTIAVFLSLRRLRLLRLRSHDPFIGFGRATIGGSITAIIAAGMFTNYQKAEVLVWCLALLPVVETLSRQIIQREEAAADEGDKDASPEAAEITNRGTYYRSARAG